MSLVSLTLLAVALAFAPTTQAPKSSASGAYRVTAASGAMRGFSQLLSSQLQRSFSSADRSLVKGSGYPVEPGFHVTIHQDRLKVLDQDAVALAKGRLVDAPVAKACKSGCPFPFWAAFSSAWARNRRSAARSGYTHPQRLLFALQDQLPASTFLQAAYAGLESWPGSAPPSVFVLVDAGPGGIRARQVRLMPPGGVDASGVEGALGLRVRVLEGDRFEISANAPNFAQGGTVKGKAALTDRLESIKRRFPTKRVLVVEPDPSCTAGQLTSVFDASFETFPDLILAPSPS